MFEIDKYYDDQLYIYLRDQNENPNETDEETNEEPKEICAPYTKEP